MLYLAALVYLAGQVAPLGPLCAAGCALGLVYCGRQIDRLVTSSAPVPAPIDWAELAGWTGILTLAAVAGFLLGEWRAWW